MQDIETPVEELPPIKGNPPTKAEKLYDGLLKSGFSQQTLGDKSKFISDVQDPIKANKLYTGLRSSGFGEDVLGDMVTFRNNLIVPPKAGGAGSPLTPNSLSNGLNPFQSSQPSTPYSGITTSPQAAQNLLAMQPKTPRDRVLDIYRKSLSPDEVKALSQGTQQSLQQHQNDTITDTPQSQQGDYDYAQTLPGKIQNGVTYLAQKATKGGLQVVKGAAYLAQLGANAQAGLGLTDTHDFDKPLDAADKATDFLSKTSQNQVENSKVMSNLGGLAEFLPSAIAGESTGGATFYLQGMGQGKETMDQAEKAGAKINPIVKNAFILGAGAVNGLLMGDLGHGIFNSLSGSLKDDVVANITTNAIKDAAEKDITAQGFKDLLQQGAKDWADKALQGGTNFLKNTKKAVIDLSALNVGNFALKQGVDATTDKPLFNENLGDLANQEGETLKAAPMFGAVGSIGDATKLTPFSSYKNAIVDGLMQDSSPENIERTKQFVNQHGAEQGWTPEEITATNNHIDKIAQVTKSLPKNLADNKVEPAVDLVLSRNDLQKQLTDARNTRSQLDPALSGIESPHEQFLADKIEQANDKLRDIATGSKTTYSQERDESGKPTGKFLKMVDGKSEEISENRYNLERTERDAKVKPKIDEQTSKNQEISAETPAPPVATDENSTDEPTTQNSENNISTEENGKTGQETGRVENAPVERQGENENAGGESSQPNAEKEVVKRNQVSDADAPTLKELAGNLKETGEPGIAEEDKYKRQYDGDALTDEKLDNGTRTIVSRGEDGKVTGALEISYNGKNGEQKEPVSVKVVVDENNRRKGIATSLFKHAEEKGINLSDVRGKETTEAGQALYEANKNLPPKEAVNEPQQKNDKEPIGITKEETKKQREIRGLEDLPEADRVSLNEMFDNGKIAVESKEIDPTELANVIAEKPRNLSNTEVNALLYDRQNIRQELESIRNKIDKKINSEEDIPENIEALQNRQRYLESQLDTNERAIRSGARENSLALNAMKNMINSDYTLATQRARMRAAAGGELTPAMEAELDKYKAERDEALKRLDDYEKAQQDKELVKEIQRQARDKNKTASKEALKIERKSIVDDFRAELKRMRQSGEFNSVGKATAQFLSAAAPFMQKMLTNLIKEGIVEAKDIVATIRDEFKNDIDGLTDRDIIDALSGKYSKKRETKDELVLQRESVKRVLNLTARLEDLKNRKTPEKSEKLQVQKNKEIERLEQQIKDEKKKINVENAGDRSKESLRKKLDLINERIKKEDFSKGQTATSIKPDAEHITLQAKVKKAENNFDAMAERLHMHNKTGFEKTLTTIQQIRRAMLLSGTKTLAKLYSFAAARSVTTPLEEAITSLNTKIPGLNKIAEQSPRFNTGFNAKAEAQAITTRWSKATLGDSWKDVLKSGVGELDRLYGKHGVDKDFDLNPSALEFFGRLHGAFKNSTKRAEFFRSFQKRLEYAAKQGKDINDPNIQFVTGLDAYADAKRSILMNDNLLVDKGYKSLLRGLEQSSKDNPNNAGKAVAAVIKGLFPIVKIPTNYVLESTDVATLGLRAIPNLIKAMTKGADTLTPKEADMTMRTLAKGQVGLALMIYAYNNPQMFGGYYSGQRANNDLGSGEIKMFGHVLPHFLSHNPYFEAMQIAATMRRAVDKASHGYEKSSGIPEGSKTAVKGLTEQIPFNGLSDIFGDRNATAGDVAGKAVKGLVEPRLLQEVAEATDKQTDERHKRAPKGFEEQLKSGLPILRETVPLKNKKKY